MNICNYVPPIAPKEENMDFIADSIVRRLPDKNHTTTEIIIDLFRSMNDDYDDWWGRGLNTEAKSRGFVYMLIDMLMDRGVKTVVDNSF